MSRNRVLLVVLLALAGAFVSAILLGAHHGHHGIGAAVADGLCGAGEESGCEEVSRSRYSEIGSLSLAALGVAFYGAVLLLLAFGLASSDAVRESAAAVALLAFGLALAIDAVLLGVQAFAIGAYCRLCLATYVLNLAAFATLWPLRSKVSGITAASEARRALSVWAVSAVVIAIAVGAVDRTLASAEPAPQTLLGEAELPADPAPPAELPVASEATSTVAPAETAPPALPGDNEGLQAQLQTAQARIQELQATLDDPQKFQAYQEQRAAENFERQPKVELDLGGVPVKGPKEAPIQVVEFSDFLCPFCRNLAGAFGGFMPQSQGRVAVFFKHYPLDQACNPVMTRTVHDGACELALGGVCAEEQGKFWEYHDRIFSQPPTNPSNDDVVRLAGEAGLDGEAMRQCLTSPGARAKLDRDIAEGKRLQVNATPTVFVNGKRLEQIGGFLKAIESESKRLGLPPLAPRPSP
jgi:protein-disulfide isomerase/uncharacterized membrane protein